MSKHSHSLSRLCYMCGLKLTPKDPRQKKASLITYGTCLLKSTGNTSYGLVLREIYEFKGLKFIPPTQSTDTTPNMICKTCTKKVKNLVTG